jgi:hypothetical protein
MRPQIAARAKVAAGSCALAAGLGVVALSPAVAQAAVVQATAAAPAKPTALSVTTNKGSYAYGTNAKITVTLKNTVGDRAVKVYATPAGGKAKLIASGQVNAKGKFFPAYVVTKATKFTAVFAGDKANKAAKASRSVTAQASVLASLSGFKKTVKVSGVTYAVFTTKQILTLHSKVLPGKGGQCLQPETQQWDKTAKGAKWDADTKYGCDSLTSDSKDTSPFNLAQAVGDKYRIRAQYVASSKDKSNLSANSVWLYFQVVT